MSNLSGKAYGMNMVSPMKPWRTWFNTFLFMLGRAMPGTLKGLLGLSLIHFARWVMIKRADWPDLGQGKQDLGNDYMLFCSNFNGTWDQYIDAFSDGIPDGLDLFWYSSVKWPHSIPITTFKDYINHNQISTDYYFNATPRAAQRDIKASLGVYKELKDLAKTHGSMSPGEFATAYKKVMYEVQNKLGAQGTAPVASNDTSRAAKSLRKYVNKRWGAKKNAGGNQHA